MSKPLSRSLFTLTPGPCAAAPFEGSPRHSMRAVSGLPMPGGLCLALLAALIQFFTASTARAAPEISIEQPVGTPLGDSVLAWGWNANG